MIKGTATKRLWAVLAAMALFLTACGGSDDSTNAGASGGSDSGSSDSGSVDDGSEDDSDSLDDAEDIIEAAEDAGVLVDSGGSATIAIGGQSWELGVFEGNPIAQCNPDFFGGFIGILSSEGSLGTPLDLFSVTLPGGDFTDPPTATLKVAIGTEAEWIADETVYELNPDFPTGIGVTDFSINGSTATGTAVFYEQESFYQFTAGLADELEMAEGTFQVTCAG